MAGLENDDDDYNNNGMNDLSRPMCFGKEIGNSYKSCIMTSMCIYYALIEAYFTLAVETSSVLFAISSLVIY